MLQALGLLNLIHISGGCVLKWELNSLSSDLPAGNLNTQMHCSGERLLQQRTAETVSCIFAIHWCCGQNDAFVLSQILLFR